MGKLWNMMSNNNVFYLGKKGNLFIFISFYNENVFYIYINNNINNVFY